MVSTTTMKIVSILLFCLCSSTTNDGVHAFPMSATTKTTTITSSTTNNKKDTQKNQYSSPYTITSSLSSSRVTERMATRLSLSSIDSAMSSSSSSDDTTNMEKENDKAIANANDMTVDWDWKKVAEGVFPDNGDQRPIILFDGVCNLCNSGINFAMDQDETAKFRFCSLQSTVAQSLLLRAGKSYDDQSNIVLVTKDEAYFSSDAVSRICMELDAVPLQWFGQLGQFTPDWIRESIYKFVSTNRYKFGENDSCRLDFDGTYTSRFVSEPDLAQGTTTNQIINGDDDTAENGSSE